MVPGSIIVSEITYIILSKLSMQRILEVEPHYKVRLIEDEFRRLMFEMPDPPAYHGIMVTS